jgi:N-acetylglucosamine kinase-like BadF-type ATPase
MNVLAIDGGASTAKWCVQNQEGKTLIYQTTGPLSGHIFNSESRKQSETILRNICNKAHKIAPISKVVAGISGLDSKSHQANWIRGVIEKSLNTKDILISDDLFFVFLGLSSPGEGLLVYAGTGCIAYHLTKDYNVIRANGYGYLIDDCGGGFWIGQQALKQWLRSMETHQPTTSALDERLVKKFGSRDWNIVREKVYKGGRETVASVTKEVRFAANVGDPNALKIFHEAGIEIGKLANRLFAMTELKETEMHLIGGVTNCHEFLDTGLRGNLDSNIQYSPIISNNAEIMASIVKKYSFKQLAHLSLLS